MTRVTRREFVKASSVLAAAPAAAFRAGWRTARREVLDEVQRIHRKAPDVDGVAQSDHRLVVRRVFALHCLFVDRCTKRDRDRCEAAAAGIVLDPFDGPAEADAAVRALGPEGRPGRDVCLVEASLDAERGNLECEIGRAHV